MNYPLITVASMSIILPFFFQLALIAGEASELTLTFATEMTDDLECVLNGVRLTDCQEKTVSQEELLHTLAETQELLQEFEEEITQ